MNKSNLIAHMWHCGDDECNCFQPMILKVLSEKPYKYEKIEEGLFVSDPDQEEWNALRAWLLDKAKHYSVLNLEKIEKECQPARLGDAVEDFISSQTDLPADFKVVLQEHLWQLY